MIKGINKQIVEIKCPKNEQYEKILLFTKQNSDVNRVSEIDEDMLEMYRSIMSQSKQDNRERNNAVACIVMLSLACLFLLGFLVFTLL